MFLGTVVHREYWVLKIIVTCPTTNFVSGLVTAGFGRAFHLISKMELQSSVLSHLLVAHWPSKGPWGQHSTCLGKEKEKYWVAFWEAKGELSVHISLGLFDLVLGFFWGVLLFLNLFFIYSVQWKAHRIKLKGENMDFIRKQRKTLPAFWVIGSWYQTKVGLMSLG